MWSSRLAACHIVILTLVLFATAPVQVGGEGNVGCFFSSDLCEKDEVCFDDNAFGRCQKKIPGKSSRNYFYKHQLDSNALRILENEMKRLYSVGYRWDHDYTQCVIRQILYSDQFKIHYDPGLCSRLLRLTSPDIPPEVAMDLSFGDANDVASIRYTPDSSGDTYAKEVYNPPGPEREEQEGESNEVDKKSVVSQRNQNEALLDFLNKLKLDENLLLSDIKTNDADVFPEDNIPILQTELSSDLNHKPIYTETGTKWVAIDTKDDREEEDKSISEESPASSDGASSDRMPIFVDSMSDDAPDEDDVESLGFEEANYEESKEGRPLFRRPKPWSFSRQHRYDTKKPGPTYFYHEPESSEDHIETNDVNAKDATESTKGDEKMGLSASMLFASAQLKNEAGKQAKEKKRKTENKSTLSEGPVHLISIKNKTDIKPTKAGEETNYEAVDATHTFIIFDRRFNRSADGNDFVMRLQGLLQLPRGTFTNISVQNTQVTFKVNRNPKDYNASVIATKVGELSDLLRKERGPSVESAGIGDKQKYEFVSRKAQEEDKLRLITISFCALVSAAICAAFVLFWLKRHENFREKLKSVIGNEKGDEEREASQDYQDLCRQRMQSKEKKEKEKEKEKEREKEKEPSPPSRSSTSSWNEEPIGMKMEISTGHMILEYMEEYLKNKDRLDSEWESLCLYEPDGGTNCGNLPENKIKNRYPDVLPLDHSRVLLNDLMAVDGSDYINANTISDVDPRNPCYILTQGPLQNTVNDFWQMVWEQGVIIIVILTRIMENGVELCHKYWPEEGSQIYNQYEVHLVSEHIWSDDYLVRSFYLKNIKTNETRTVTQFHYLSWPVNSVPSSTKSLLDFRRKVNKSYRGRSCPILIHCNDGIGRSGTYCLLDMVLNRMIKGSKEIDIEASLEHIRDQRGGAVKTKQQFEFVLKCVADEVNAILKTLSHS